MLESDCGPAGSLAKLAITCHKINDSLTRVTDAFFGPDATDTFDASCNTCKHFKRIRFDRKTNNPSVWGFPGTCQKLSIPTTGHPRGKYCGFENEQCYENRRTGKTVAEISTEMRRFNNA